MASRTNTLRISVVILCLLLATSTFFPLCDAKSHGRGLQGLKIRRTSINRPWKKLKSHNHLDIYTPLLGSSSLDTYGGSPSSLPLPPYNSLAPQPTPSSSASPYPPFTPGSGGTDTPTLPAYSPAPNPPHYVPVPPSSTHSPPKHDPSPPKSVPSPPQVYLPPVIYPPPPSSSPSPHKKPQYAVWCVAKPTVPDPIIQEAMDYACGSGADCKSIEPNGSCYQPNTLLAHASYAFNSYWQNTKTGGGTCDFGGTAMLVTTDPSFDRCRFPLT